MTSNELLSVKQQFGIIGNTEALNTAIDIAEDLIDSIRDSKIT